jgi:hypothetical protein
MNADVALNYVNAGISVIPVLVRTKKPIAAWKVFQSRLPTAAELKSSVPQADGLAMVCGVVSDNLETLDFDLKAELYPAWARLVEEMAPGLLSRLVIEKSQNQGVHVSYRCADVTIPGNDNFARRPVDVGEEVKRLLLDGGVNLEDEVSVKRALPSLKVNFSGKSYQPRLINGKFIIVITLIESRGEGGYFLAHPTPGYDLIQGDFLHIPTITPKERQILVNAAIALNEYVDTSKVEGFGYRLPKETRRPGDDFNERGDVTEVLAKHSWKPAGGNDVYQYFCRPGKERGISASLIGGKWFRVFSSNADPFESETAYPPFAVFALLECDGDFTKAASELVKMGYGEKFYSDQEPQTDQDYDRLEREAIQAEGQAQPQSPTKDFLPLDYATITPITEWIKTPPPPRDYLFEEVLPTGIVGGMIAIGGTGKGFILMMMGLSWATCKMCGPLKPARKFKILYLAGEDDQEELKRRTVWTIEAMWPDGPPPEIDNFIPVSVAGKLGPIMQKDWQGNPTNAPAYAWLCKTLENLPDIDVVLLDPKSKFYGLDENDNGHNTAWINCLESLAARFKITILFSHHESKARAGSMEQVSSRGGSALTDGCRWVANIKTMDPKTGEKFQVSDPHNYVVLDVTKSNYAPKLPAPIYFRRVSGGALVHVDLVMERAKTLALELVTLLKTQLEPLSRNDLIYEKKGKEITDELKETVEGFNRVKDINLAVDYALRSEWLTEIRQTNSGGRPKLVLMVNETGGR